MTVLRPWPWPVQTDLELWEQLVARWTVVLCVVRLCSLQNVVDVHLKAERVELSETRNRNDTRSLLAPHCVSQSHGVLPGCHVTLGPTWMSQWHVVLPGCHSDTWSYLDVTVTQGPTCMSRDTGSYLYVTVTRGPTCMSRDTGSYLYVTVTRGATCRSVTLGRTWTSQWHWVLPGCPGHRRRSPWRAPPLQTWGSRSAPPCWTDCCYYTEQTADSVTYDERHHDERDDSKHLSITT